MCRTAFIISRRCQKMCKCVTILRDFSYHLPCMGPICRKFALAFLFCVGFVANYDRMKGLPRIICVPHVAMQEYHALISNKYIKLPPLSTISRPFILFKSIIRIRSSLRMGELQAHRSPHLIAMQLFPTSYAGDIYCMFAPFADISPHSRSKENPTN